MVKMDLSLTIALEVQNTVKPLKVDAEAKKPNKKPAETYFNLIRNCENISSIVSVLDFSGLFESKQFKITSHNTIAGVLHVS